MNDNVKEADRVEIDPDGSARRMREEDTRRFIERRFGGVSSPAARN